MLNINGLVGAKREELSRSAKWITHPVADRSAYGVYHFRKIFTLDSIPTSFLINISADNHYRLFVNGHPVCSGSAKGDRDNWFYDTVNISNYLVVSNNILAAMVWNMGEYAPVSQISLGTGFYISGSGATEQALNTNHTWKVEKDSSYKPCSLHTSQRLNAYMAIGPGDYIDFTQYSIGWETLSYDDSKWPQASIIPSCTENKISSQSYNLVPRQIPFLEERSSTISYLRKVTVVSLDEGSINWNDTLEIPPNTDVTLLFDMGCNTVTYPELTISGGANTVIKLTYAESLFDDNGNKGDRDIIANKKVYGLYDLLKASYAGTFKFRPLTFRCFRYVQIDVSTANDPLKIINLKSTTIGYPLTLRASFQSNDKTLNKIWAVGWHTLKLCAGEMFYDTPYYEQLQYIGDARIQALIMLYTDGDDRLMKKAITDFSRSQIECGLLQSRYPSKRLQVIPGFSLFWISMLIDFWMHRDDNLFVKNLLPTVSKILHWFQRHIDKRRNMLGPLPFWNFVDWDNFDERGSAPGSHEGNSAILTLHFCYTLKEAAKLFKAFGLTAQAQEFISVADILAASTFRQCFNYKMGLIADTPEQETFSQHAGIWAIMCDCVPKHRIRRMMFNILDRKGIGQVTYFYRFYLAQALKKSGLAELYYDQLHPWYQMLDLGLTTFAEKPEPTRSDCHAWSASPTYDFLATICGIIPAEPNFKSIIIQPALGGLSYVTGKMPHPNGLIEVKLIRNGQVGINAKISIPPFTTGEFIWNNKTYPLSAGEHSITV